MQIRDLFFSEPDQSFVCQKKNHFQITTNIKLSVVPMYVLTSEGPKEVTDFYLQLNGCKSEAPSHTIDIMQSQSDRSKKYFHPHPIDLTLNPSNKVTIGRLHFAETTMNNMRRKGKRNPGQKFFHLVVTLQAYVGKEIYTLVSHTSDKLIVRATSPGQFENDGNEPLRLLKMENLLLKQQLLASPRFAVNSNLSNCYARTINVNGHSRIGIFTKRDIFQGEELVVDTSDTSEVYN